MGPGASEAPAPPRDRRWRGRPGRAGGGPRPSGHQPQRPRRGRDARATICWS